MHVKTGPASAYQRLLRITCGNHSRQRRKPFPQVAVELRALLVFVSRDYGINPKQQDVSRVEPGIQLVKIVQRAHQQSGSGKNDDR